MKKTRKEAPPGSRILTLKVTLEESNPPIWRRFEIDDHSTLNDLHYALQIVMGWENSHLHEFSIGGESYGAILPDDYDQEPTNDERQFELREVLTRKRAKLEYLYDFGNCWAHKIVVEDISEPEPGTRYPRCTAGERNCPPEDCGGVYGYDEMLEILEDPTHEEYEMYREWVPDDFDTEAFDVARVNKQLDEIGKWFMLLEDDDALEAVDETPPAFDYEEPVSRLLTLGQPGDPLDYGSLGIGREHVPVLIRMAADMALHHALSDSDEVWAPLHAWRALGQLRAEEAVVPLVHLLRLVDEEGDDWAGEDLPEAISEIGAPAVPVLSACLQDRARGLWARVAASAGLAKVGQKHPGSRDTCVASLTAQLERFSEEPEELNVFLVSALMDLDAVEAAPVMERAFAADAVDLSIHGDWEEVQIEMGLLDERLTPPPEAGWLIPKMLGEHRTHKLVSTAPKPAPPPSGGKKKAKKAKRKHQKASRKRNRRK
ncbi:MAG TPA: DUF1186 domain-containing protein [Candidatus Hydrogenedentes bacterium]|nr:DUF1186 domain-containing protein [Candidatus Hydrogenedentota bacterium]